MTLRVLHVVTSMGVGGVEVWLTSLLAHIAERNDAAEVQFDICLTGGARADLDDVAESLGAKLHYVPFGRKTFFPFRRQFRKVLDENRYDVVHDHQDYSSAWHLVAGLGSLPPVRIVHVHNPPVCLRINTNTPARKAMFQIAARIVRRLATHVLGTSGQVLREYGFTPAEFPRQVIRTLHCGFDVGPLAASHADANASLCRELGWPQGSRICLFVGRLEGFDPENPEWNHKNPEFALDVVHEAILGGADIYFAVAGAGERMLAILEKRVAEWNLTHRIRLLGRRLDVPRLMAASHICLFPSREEGLGMVGVEAQAAGLRLLASDSIPREMQVIPEIVTFLPLDSGLVAWAGELTRLAALPRFNGNAAAQALSESAYSIDRSFDDLMRIYTRSDLLAHSHSHS